MNLWLVLLFRHLSMRWWSGTKDWYFCVMLPKLVNLSLLNTPVEKSNLTKNQKLFCLFNTERNVRLTQVLLGSQIHETVLHSISPFKVWVSTHVPFIWSYRVRAIQLNSSNSVSYSGKHSVFFEANKAPCILREKSFQNAACCFSRNENKSLISKGPL